MSIGHYLRFYGDDLIQISLNRLIQALERYDVAVLTLVVISVRLEAVQETNVYSLLIRLQWLSAIRPRYSDDFARYLVTQKRVLVCFIGKPSTAEFESVTLWAGKLRKSAKAWLGLRLVMHL